MALEWYILAPDSQNEFLSANYTKNSSPICNGNPDFICAIEANEVGSSGKPDIIGDSVLRDQMSLARANPSTLQPRVKIRSTR